MGKNFKIRLSPRFLAKILLAVAIIGSIAYISPAAAQYRDGYAERGGRNAHLRQAPNGGYVDPNARFYSPATPPTFFYTQPSYGLSGGYYQPNYDFELQQKFQRRQALEEQRLAREREWFENESFQQLRPNRGSRNGLPHTIPTSRASIACNRQEQNYLLSPPEWSFSLNVTTCFNRRGDVSGFFHNGQWWRFLS